MQSSTRFGVRKISLKHQSTQPRSWPAVRVLAHQGV